MLTISFDFFTAPLPHLSASYYSPNSDDSFVVLANSVGNLNVVKLGNLKGYVTVNALKSGSYFGRLLGCTGGILGGGGGSGASGGSGGGSGGAGSGGGGGGKASGEASEAVMSLEMTPVHNDIYVFGLCKDHKIRMWSACKLFFL